MKQFIISEQEKQRILEMHQGATSRHYLMEGNIHTGQVIDIILPWTKNETGAVIPAVNAFTKPEYTPTFIYYVGFKESDAIKANGNKPVSQITKIEDNITGTVIPTYGTQTYDSATNTIRGKVVPPTTAQKTYSWDATKTSNYSVTFQDGGIINPIAVKYKQGKEYVPLKNKTTMKQFIISEQEKQRILEIHQGATSRQYLMEGEQTAVLSLDIPTTNGQIDSSKNIPFSIGPLGKNAANEYTGILTNMTINNQTTNKLTNQKLNGEYVTGEIVGNYDHLFQSALNNVVSDDLFDPSSTMYRYSARFVRKKDPNNPSSPGQQTVYISKIIKKLTPTQK